MYNTVVLWHVIYLSKGVSLTPYFSVDECSMNMMYVCMYDECGKRLQEQDVFVIHKCPR